MMSKSCTSSSSGKPKSSSKTINTKSHTCSGRQGETFLKHSDKKLHPLPISSNPKKKTKYVSCKKVIPHIYYFMAKGHSSFMIRRKLSEIFDTNFSRNRLKYYIQKGKDVGLWSNVDPMWKNIFSNEFYINRIVTIKSDKKYDMVVQVQNLTNAIIVRPNNYILTIPITTSIGSIGKFQSIMSKKMNHNIWSNNKFSDIIYFRNHNDKTLLCGLRKSFYCVVFNEIEAKMLVSDVKKRILSEVKAFLDWFKYTNSVDLNGYEWVNGEDAIRHPYLKKFLDPQTTFRNEFVKKVYKRDDEFEILGSEEERTLRRERAITNLTVVPYAEQINSKLDFTHKTLNKIAIDQANITRRFDSLTTDIMIPFFSKLGLKFPSNIFTQKKLDDYLKQEEVSYIG